MLLSVFGFEGGVCYLIVLVPDHYIPVYFSYSIRPDYNTICFTSHIILQIKFKVSHSLIAVWVVGLEAQQMKDRAHPSLLAALFFPGAKTVPIYCSVNRQSFPVDAWRSPVPLSRPSGDFLLHQQASLTTRLWRLYRLANCLLMQCLKSK